MSESRIINILFVDAGNSARSILAEALLNRLGAGRFEGFSAGFDPVSAVSPYVLGLLHRIHYNTGWLATKPVEAMISRYIPPFDAIVRLSPGVPAGGRWPPCRQGTVIVDWCLEDPRERFEGKAMIAQGYEALFAVLISRIEAVTRLTPEAFNAADICLRLDQMAMPHPRMAG